MKAGLLYPRYWHFIHEQNSCSVRHTQEVGTYCGVDLDDYYRWAGVLKPIHALIHTLEVSPVLLQILSFFCVSLKKP